MYGKLASLDAQYETAKDVQARGQVTCRDCFGFGHSVSKCPTTRILTATKPISQLFATLLTRYHQATRGGYLEYESKSRSKWPLWELWKEDKETIKKVYEGVVALKGSLEADSKLVTAKLKELRKKTCIFC
jgi:hypothetical protein